MKRLYITTALVTLATALAAPAAMAQTTPSRNEIYAGVGTTGGTVGYGLGLGRHTAVRVEVNYLDYSRTLNTGSGDYRGSLKLGTVGAYYDFFFAGPFRITGGVLVGSNKFEGNAVTTNGYVTINHQQYDASGQWANGTIKFRAVSPYVGLGWGHRPERGGFGFFGDLGVAYGRPSVTLNVSDGLRQAAGDANIAAEQASLQRKADKLKFFPVLRIGIDYQW